MHKSYANSLGVLYILYKVWGAFLRMQGVFGIHFQRSTFVRFDHLLVGVSWGTLYRLLGVDIVFFWLLYRPLWLLCPDGVVFAGTNLEVVLHDA